MFTVFPWHVLLISPISHTAFLNGLQEKSFHRPQEDAKLTSSVHTQHAAANFSWYKHISLETQNTIDALSLVPERGHCHIFPSKYV